MQCSNGWRQKGVLSPVYTGPTNSCTDKNLHGSTLHLRGTGRTGRIFERLSVQVQMFPCKCKVEPCKFLSVQKFVRTRVNVALVMTTAMAVATSHKKRIYLRILQLFKSVHYAYLSKNLLRLNTHRQRSIPNEDTRN